MIPSSLSSLPTLRRAAIALVLGLLPPIGATAQPQTDPDWPCIQRLVPELAPAALWQGPTLPATPGDWRDDKEVADLVPALLAPDLPLDQASAEIESFASSREQAERAEQAALLFTGLVDTANAQRSRLIDGLKRFARKQRALAGQINQETHKLRDLEAQGTRGAMTEAADTREAWTWDMRVYDERQHTLTLLCQQPVMLEQRLFALSRTLADTLQ